MGFYYSVNPHEQHFSLQTLSCFSSKAFKGVLKLNPSVTRVALAAVLPHLGVKWPRGVTLSTCLGWLWRHFGCKDSARAGTQTLESRGSGAQQLFVCVNLDSCARTSPGEVMTLRSGGIVQSHLRQCVMLFLEHHSAEWRKLLQLSQLQGWVCF